MSGEGGDSETAEKQETTDRGSFSPSVSVTPHSIVLIFLTRCGDIQHHLDMFNKTQPCLQPQKPVSQNDASLSLNHVV